MRDIVVLAIIAGFFLLCVAYVRWCDHIMGPDPDDLRDTDDIAAHEAPELTEAGAGPSFDAQEAVGL